MLLSIENAKKLGGDITIDKRSIKIWGLILFIIAIFL